MSAISCFSGVRPDDPLTHVLTPNPRLARLVVSCSSYWCYPLEIRGGGEAS